MSEFKDWNLDKQLKHVEHMFKEGAKEYKLENPVPLADSIDCMEYWGPWALDEITRLKSRLELADRLADAYEREINSHRHTLLALQDRYAENQASDKRLYGVAFATLMDNIQERDRFLAQSLEKVKAYRADGGSDEK